MFCLSFAAILTAQDSKLYEMRIYHSPEGKLENLIQRFENHTVALFEKHGMQNLGYWVPMDNSANILIYVLSYPDMEARKKSWSAFGGDPDWQKAAKESEVDGKIVSKVESYFMDATDFSPEIKESNVGNRVFELRRYYPTPGKKENIVARFRDHTTKLFEKHGMQNIAYWTSRPDKDGNSDLIYILAHKSKEDGMKSFDAFRVDPAWVKVKTESEASGPIVTKVESIYMVPLKFSRMK